MTVSFSVPGVAKSERKRQRFLAGVGTVGKRTDEPDRADWKAWVRLMAKSACLEPLAGPLSVTVEVRREAPSSNPKRPTKGNPWPFAWWKKPDCENLAKPILDACNGVAWHDDGQIVSLTVRKRYGDKAETLVVIETEEATT